MITVKAGKVPGAIIELTLQDGRNTVLSVMQLASQELGRQRGLNKPAFEVYTAEYTAGNRQKVDVPQLNGRLLADRVGERFENINWQQPVKDNDIVLVVPKIQGAQFVVNVAVIPGTSFEVAINEQGENGEDSQPGTIAAALRAANVEMQEGDSISVNGENTNDLDGLLESGDNVVVIRAALAPRTDNSSEENNEDNPLEDDELDNTSDLTEYEKDLREQASNLLASADKIASTLKTYREANLALSNLREELL